MERDRKGEVHRSHRIVSVMLYLEEGGFRRMYSVRRHLQLIIGWIKGLGMKGEEEGEGKRDGNSSFRHCERVY
jgi:hypothetical protein